MYLKLPTAMILFEIFYRSVACSDTNEMSGSRADFVLHALKGTRVLCLYFLLGMSEIFTLLFRQTESQAGRAIRSGQSIPRVSLLDHLHAKSMATDEDIEALSMLGGYLIFSILQRRPLHKILTLIDAGAPLWYQDDEGTSPLHAAAYIEDEELVRMLIEKGAIWNAGNVKRRGISQIAHFLRFSKSITCTTQLLTLRYR